MAGFSFVNATGSLLGPELLTFGVVDDDIMSGPGGVFFGLIKNTDSWIRPTFLGQTDIKSFTVDLMITFFFVLYPERSACRTNINNVIFKTIIFNNVMFKKINI